MNRTKTSFSLAIAALLLSSGCSYIQDIVGGNNTTSSAHRYHDHQNTPFAAARKIREEYAKNDASTNEKIYAFTRDNGTMVKTLVSNTENTITIKTKYFTSKKVYYPPGRWKLNESAVKYDTALYLVSVYEKLFLASNIINSYGREAKFKLRFSGSTSSSHFKPGSGRRYKGPLISETATIDGVDRVMSIRNGQVINKNPELGFLRAYDVYSLLKSYAPKGKSIIPFDAEFNVITNDGKGLYGGSYRYVVIDILIEDEKK
jgi:hypothetical protein